MTGASTAAVVKLPICASYSWFWLPYGAAAIREVISGCGTSVSSEAYGDGTSVPVSFTNARQR